MEMKAKRLEITETLLADWRGHNIDVVIAPGFAMPAVKLGYAGWLLGAITYTSAYNLLNFPVGSVPVINIFLIANSAELHLTSRLVGMVTRKNIRCWGFEPGSSGRHFEEKVVQRPPSSPDVAIISRRLNVEHNIKPRLRLNYVGFLNKS